MQRGKDTFESPGQQNWIEGSFSVQPVIQNLFLSARIAVQEEDRQGAKFCAISAAARQIEAALPAAKGHLQTSI
jgi:hypothetical protein